LANVDWVEMASDSDRKGSVTSALQPRCDRYTTRTACKPQTVSEKSCNEYQQYGQSTIRICRAKVSERVPKYLLHDQRSQEVAHKSWIVARRSYDHSSAVLHDIGDRDFIQS